MGKSEVGQLRLKKEDGVGVGAGVGVGERVRGKGGKGEAVTEIFWLDFFQSKQLYAPFDFLLHPQNEANHTAWVLGREEHGSTFFEKEKKRFFLAIC